MLERHAFLELVHCVEPRAAAIIRVRSKKESRLIPIFTIFRPLFFLLVSRWISIYFQCANSLNQVKAILFDSVRKCCERPIFNLIIRYDCFCPGLYMIHIPIWYFFYTAARIQFSILLLAFISLLIDLITVLLCCRRLSLTHTIPLFHGTRMMRAWKFIFVIKKRAHGTQALALSLSLSDT